MLNTDAEGRLVLAYAGAALRPDAMVDLATLTGAVRVALGARTAAFRERQPTARGDRPRAGAIDAALFLREFTGGRSWAHLDIAGAARAGGDDGEISKGATGYGVRALLEWLAPAAGDAS